MNCQTPADVAYRTLGKAYARQEVTSEDCGDSARMYPTHMALIRIEEEGTIALSLHLPDL